MLGERDGTSDEDVGMFEEHDELMGEGGFGAMFGTDVGDGIPSMFNGAADPVLVMLRKPMPECRGSFARA